MNTATSPETLDYVPGDTPITYAEPEKGMRILINNAGGFNQHPGRYGYTETVILDIETVDRGTYTSTRVQTARYGWGCWEAADKRVKVRA